MLLSQFRNDTFSKMIFLNECDCADRQLLRRQSCAKSDNGSAARSLHPSHKFLDRRYTGGSQSLHPPAHIPLGPTHGRPNGSKLACSLYIPTSILLANQKTTNVLVVPLNIVRPKFNTKRTPRRIEIQQHALA